MKFWLVVYWVFSVVFVVILIIGIANFFLPKIRQNREKQRKAAVLEEENRIKEDMVKQLREKQERFLSDPKYIERIAREELGKARTGETIFRFNSASTNDIHHHP